MQQNGNAPIRFSPSDLVTFLGCNHATFLCLKALHEDREAANSDAMAELLQDLGIKHEAEYLQRLKDEGKHVVEIPQHKQEFTHRLARTIDAMKSGADVIYQAVLHHEQWHGYADFLIKCDTPSKFGNYSYEVLDTKLARSGEPKHVIQLCVYSELLEIIQGVRPVSIHLFLGSEEQQSFKVADFFYYYSRTKARFEHYVKNAPTDSYPDPCNHCGFCQWSKTCKEVWEKDDHLSHVANIQRSQRTKLVKAGITTLAQLAQTPEKTVIPDLNPDVFKRLRSQAALQYDKATTGKHSYVLLPPVAGKGFQRMPVPDEGDLFFDMEGDPLYPDGGLEYLFGVYYLDDNRKGVFRAFWGHNHQEEKLALQAFMDFTVTHLERYPKGHVYHYNHYETTALKRLSCRHGVCEQMVDDLLRQEKFIDLYVVVREALRTSESGYSIKNLEAFYLEKRSEEVGTAMDSILVYHEWCKTQEPKLLHNIAAYNEVDCISTQKLQEWLLTFRPKGTPWFKEALEGALPAVESSPEAEGLRVRKQWEVDYEDYSKHLGMNEENPSPLNVRLAHILEFHNREAKPQWWAHFERINKFEDELIDDVDCLGGLQLMGEPVPVKRSKEYTYACPIQETKLKVGDVVKVIDTERLSPKITVIDENNNTIKVTYGKPLPERMSVGPTGPIDTTSIRAGIYRYADHLLNEPNTPHVITELLSRNTPRIAGKQLGEPIILTDNVKDEAVQAIAGLQHSYLFIQGPPGAGKTYTSSHIIVDLLKMGKKIGVSSNSHEAIRNLLKAVEQVAVDEGVDFVGFKKTAQKNSEKPFKHGLIRLESTTAKMDLSAQLFAGTAWTFSNEYFEGQLDYLFIDEAGQLSTAHVVGMAGATKNIILVGDQMQLGQPCQGTHPGEAGLSVLEFLLKDHATIPPERGIFLGQTWRMRPSICQFISDAFYDGRLTANECTTKRALHLKEIDLPNEGIVVIPAEHSGCSQKSVEEGAIIKAKFEALIGQEFTDENGETRPITIEDILVVAPYNVQVNYLRSILRDNAKVGTVDKFQGQEAPIVFVSMTSSSAEDLPRNIEFLYSKNRLNVAVSRAQCLAIVVANPKLMEIPCNTVEQMKLVNTFCWLDVYANGAR
ncbi:MAG: TM0106 family RecB-like putative nuclease [Pseudomonadota bacterium]